MSKIIITLISDTHTKHNELSYNTKDLPGGDLLIHAGDIMNSGRNSNDIIDFCDWFTKQKYDSKIFIAGNHDRMFEDYPEMAMEIVNAYTDIKYLQDSYITVKNKVKIYGSPWQPVFNSWAFNLPKGGKELQDIWANIPRDTDILITHGPPQDHLDVSGAPYNEPHLGCALLRHHLDTVAKPKIHVFGHIHGSYGYKFDGQTHYFNASILNEEYEYTNKPITFDWNSITNEIDFL